jgi:hypothetical protein
MDMNNEHIGPFRHTIEDEPADDEPETEPLPVPTPEKEPVPA